MNTRTKTLSVLLLGIGASCAFVAAAQDLPPPGAGAPTPSQANPAPGAAKPKGTAQSDAGEPRADTSSPTASPGPIAAPPAASSGARAPGAATTDPGKSAAPGGRAAGAARPATNPRAATTDRLDLGTATVTGSQEQPKVMYIVPWKRSDIGDLAGKPMNSLVDEILAPVDRDVFKREVVYYQAVHSDANQNGAQPQPSPQGEK